MGVPHFAQTFPSTGAPQLRKNAINILLLDSAAKSTQQGIIPVLSEQEIRFSVLGIWGALKPRGRRAHGRGSVILWEGVCRGSRWGYWLRRRCWGLFRQLRRKRTRLRSRGDSVQTHAVRHQFWILCTLPRQQPDGTGLIRAAADCSGGDGAATWGEAFRPTKSHGRRDRFQ